MHSKSAIACNRRAWETTQMAKLIMITSYNTTAYLPIVRERARNSPGGRCAGPPGRKDTPALAVGPSESCPELRRAACSLRPCRTAPQGHFSTKGLREGQQRPPQRLHQSPASFPLSNSAPYPSPAWSAGYSPLNFPWGNIWLRVCCPGILTSLQFIPLCIILRINPVR